MHIHYAATSFERPCTFLCQSFSLKPSAFFQFNSINNVIFSSPPSDPELKAQYTDGITHIDGLTQKGIRQTSQDLQMLLPVTIFWPSFNISY